MSTTPLIVASNRLHPDVAARLSAVGKVCMPSGEDPMSSAELAEWLPRATAFLGFMTDRVDRAWLARAPSLRIVAAALKGYDNYDPQACADAGVWLTIVPDLLTEPTAELAIGLAIGLGRHLRAGDARVRSGTFDGWRATLYGIGLRGATVGVVGLGKVGRAIIDRLAGFEPSRVLGHDPQARNPRAQPVSLRELLAQSDVVFLAAPLTETTRHMVNADSLQWVREGQLMINVGRGSVVDEGAIADALERGAIGGYAADVFELEDWALAERPRTIDARLLAHPRTLFTPHLGSAVSEVRLAIEQRAANNIVAVLGGATPPDAINRPAA